MRVCNEQEKLAEELQFVVNARDTDNIDWSQRLFFRNPETPLYRRFIPIEGHICCKTRMCRLATMRRRDSGAPEMMGWRIG